MASRILILLSQCPLDPSSGACRSVAGIGAILAANGFDVCALGTTTSEVRAGAFDMRAHLHAIGVRDLREEHTPDGRAVLRFAHRGVSHTLLDTGGLVKDLPLRVQPDAAFESLLDGALDRFKPDALFTFGRAPAEVARHERARARGAAVVLTVRNHGYYDRRAFAGVDAVLMPSDFLAESYRARIGIHGAAITSPIDPGETVAEDREPLMLTFVGASLEKGVAIFVRLADMLAQRRPDIPMLVIPGRGSMDRLHAVAGLGGIDLARHASIMYSPGVPAPADIFRPTRVLLVPSIWREPLGRVAVEALMNGVPPIVSDRGALPEVVGDGGVVLPLPPSVMRQTDMPPPPAEVQPWVAAVERLFDDEAAYDAISQRALARARAFAPEVVNPLYIEFFRRVRAPGASAP